MTGWVAIDERVKTIEGRVADLELRLKRETQTANDVFDEILQVLKAMNEAISHFANRGVK